MCYSELQCVTVCCSVVQCCAVCCSVVQHVAVCCAVCMHVLEVEIAGMGWLHVVGSLKL